MAEKIMADTVADQIAGWLYEKGITTAFGVVGGGNVALWDAITRHSKIKLVCVHHEQAAAMAASYFYRTSGRVAACLCTTGAGSTNTLTGVVAAHMDSVPLLVISGNEASKYMGADTRVWGVQGYDSTGVVRKVTKLAYRVVNARQAVSWLETALDLALLPRQGPVWVDLPKDVQNATV